MGNVLARLRAGIGRSDRLVVAPARGLRVEGALLAAALTIVPYLFGLAWSGGRMRTTWLEWAVAAVPVAALAGSWHAPQVASRRHGLDWTTVGRVTASVVLLRTLEIALLETARGAPDGVSTAWASLPIFRPWVTA